MYYISYSTYFNTNTADVARCNYKAEHFHKPIENIGYNHHPLFLISIGILTFYSNKSYRKSNSYF